MKITHIYHSGFLVETAGCYCIFDYYRGNLPKLDPFKPVLVFASHSHADHYNPEIFTLLSKQGISRAIAVLSKDIPQKRWPGQIPVLKVTFHQQYSLSINTSASNTPSFPALSSGAQPDGVMIQTLHSTDRGVAFLVECDGNVIYHAGDLNDWSWDETSEDYSEQYNRQMTGSYRHEINLLKEWLGDRTLDAAFLPLDPRQGSMYAKGMLYFLQKIPVNTVYPMHYWDQPEIVKQFLQENPSYRPLVQIP